MFNTKQFDLSLTVAHRRDLQIWAAQLEIANASPLRTGGKAPFPGARRDHLLATGMISALGGLPRNKYQALLARARKAGAEKPRLEIKVFHGFATNLKGVVEGKDVLFISALFRQHFKKVFDGFDVTVTGIDEPRNEPNSAALLSFVQRSLMPEEYPGRLQFFGKTPYPPAVVSELGPLTPDLVSHEEQHA
jgi:hypothetical protein